MSTSQKKSEHTSLDLENHKNPQRNRNKMKVSIKYNLIEMEILLDLNKD
jgi:hypothetical protein